jgi:hypothetical protein
MLDHDMVLWSIWSSVVMCAMLCRQRVHLPRAKHFLVLGDYWAVRR